MQLLFEYMHLLFEFGLPAVRHRQQALTLTAFALVVYVQFLHSRDCAVHENACHPLSSIKSNGSTEYYLFYIILVHSLSINILVNVPALSEE